MKGQLRDYVLSIEPGAQVEIQAVGEYFRVTDADGGTVSVSTDAGDKLTVQEGEGARVSPFKIIRFQNDSAVTLRLVVIVGMGDFVSARTTGAVSPLPAGTIQAVGDYAGGATIPANADRRQLVMRASADNAGNLTIAGLPIEPGDTFELDVSGAVTLGGDGADVMHVAEVV
ncbi:hypothetical protein [Chromohalobacter israelensis]|uniref:hypothetical protein n=1 Tax=Chromohalobacter israelensis TaxID=141390 RepID=UPI00265C1871|nr:hypothetical protein [Chromohalobacter salexigens]MDO0946633.1 hypothetical protein [Chromohalobacter salexigens]